MSEPDSTSFANEGGNKAGRYLERSLKRAWSVVSGVLPLSASGNIGPATQTAVALLKTVFLSVDGELSAEEIEAFRAVFADQYDADKVDDLVTLLENCAPVTAAEAATTMATLSRGAQLSILKMLTVLGNAKPDYATVEQALVTELAELLKISPAELAQTVREAAHGKRLWKSGAGILVALIVIVVFIATATFLKSVVFGLILAYICLPIERFYEYCLQHKRNPVYWLFAGTDRLLRPLRRWADRLGHHSASLPLTEEEKTRRTTSTRISRASSLTVFTAVIAAVLLVIVLSDLSAKYVARIGSSVQTLVHAQEKPATTQVPEVHSQALETQALSREEELAKHIADAPMGNLVAAPLAGIAEAMEQLNAELEALKVRFQNIPIVRIGIEEISNFLSREDAPQVVSNFILRKTVGIFSFTAEFFSWLAALLLDVLLTVFFFSLFLTKIATAISARSDGSKDEKYSGYLVRTIFNGKWLPDAREDTLRDAENIISQIIYKLRAWLRGYLTLMSIDFVVYSTVFYFLNVPYCMLLGGLAAAGLLLPFIGPVMAAITTILVTLAVGGSAVTGLQILGIIAIFLWQNGIVEQFFLYPLVIGDALGLSTMETIIVVLLGGILAGITGMIFALPAAAVIKYLVPQIYNRWK